MRLHILGNGEFEKGVVREHNAAVVGVMENSPGVGRTSALFRGRKVTRCSGFTSGVLMRNDDDLNESRGPAQREEIV